MLKHRLIPVLILRDGQIVQSIRFNHTNLIHSDPVTAVDFFNRWEVDEIVILDVSRTLDQREKFYETVNGLSRKCFVPLTAGGWIRSVDDIKYLLRSGADKVCVNTHAFTTPTFITEAATIFGSQCIVASIDAKRNDAGRHEVYIDRGRVATGVAAVEWAVSVRDRGAGEIFLTSIDHEGTNKGYDLELMQSVSTAVDIPVIAFGGVTRWQHLVDGVRVGGVQAVSAANVFHYSEHSTKYAKQFMRDAHIDVR